MNGHLHTPGIPVMAVTVVVLIVTAMTIRRGGHAKALIVSTLLFAEMCTGLYLAIGGPL